MIHNRILLKILSLCIQIRIINGCTMFDPLTSSTTGARTIQDTINYSQNFCYGLWYMYQALSDCSGVSTTSLITFSIFTQKEKDQNRFLMGAYLEEDLITQQFNPGIVVNNGTDLYHLKFQIDSNKVESQWNHIHICYNVQTSPILINVFSSNRDHSETAQMESDYISKIDTSYTKIIQIGGAQKLMHPIDQTNFVDLLQFPGKLGNIQILNTNVNFLTSITDYLNYLQSTLPCDPPNLCSNTVTKYFISDIQLFDGKKLLEYSAKYQNGRYTIQGWAKVDPLSYDLTSNIVQLLRVSLCSYYQDNSQLGDRVFLWRYFLNSVDELNGIYVATYNMEYPAIRPYVTTPDDEFTEKSKYYNEAFYYWHYFQFQHGFDDASYNTQLQIFFQKDQSTLQHKFQDRNQGQEVSLFLSVGGDNYYLDNLMKGYIGHLSLTYCNIVDVPLMITCHYTCLTCDGPTENDCRTCPVYIKSFRILFVIKEGRGKCSCDMGYLHIDGQQDCKQLSSEFSYLTVSEIFNEDLTCSYSYFLVKGSTSQFCLPCPGVITNLGFYCADCLAKPKTWYLNTVCTYDFVLYDPSIINSVYEKRERLSINYDYYLINEEQKLLELCIGCKGQTTNESNYKQKTISQIVQIECKQCYKFDGKQCIKVIDYCNSCNNQFICLQCADGYVWDSDNQICQVCPKICQTCSLKSGVIKCASCPERYALVDGDCIQCGVNCGLCSQTTGESVTFVKCFKCIDVNLYYLSLDQVNCYRNEIQNCLIAAQQEVGGYDEFLHNSFDIVYHPAPINNGIRTVCALCKQGYKNYFHEAKCEQTTSGFQESLYQYTLNQTQEIPLKSTDPEYQEQSFVKYASQCEKQNCLWCLKNYVMTAEYCQECLAGYYAHTLSGLCFRCPANLMCKTCQHQYIKSKDAWKWDIRAFYEKALNNPDKYHNFIGFAQVLDVTKYEIICSSCPFGYELYNEKCILKCGQTCKTCQIINFVNVCKECLTTSFGQVQSTVNNICIQCPNNCAFCMPQAEAELQAMNPYFNPDIANLTYFSNICIKQIQNLNYYYDSNLGQFFECKSKPCAIQFIFDLNVYCDSDQYDSALLALGTDENKIKFFKKKNVKIVDIFSTEENTHFKDVYIFSYYQLEDFYLYQQLNSNFAKIIKFKLTLKYNNKKCSVPYNAFLISNIRKNVFSLRYILIYFRYMNLEIYGDLNYNFEIINSLSIFGFNKISFYNIKFESSSISQLLILGFTEKMNVLFDTIKINGGSSEKIQFVIQNPEKFTLQNVELNSLNLNNQGSMFNFIYNITNLQTIDIIVQSFTIKSSTFTNTQLLALPDKILQQNILISQIKIESNVIFQNSSLMQMYNQNIQQKVEIIIDQFSIKNTNIYNSQLVDLQGFSIVKITQTLISDCEMDNSILFLVSQFNVIDSVIQRNSFQKSKLFTNLGNQFTNTNTGNYLLQNLDIISNTYTSNQTFINIVQLFLNQNIIIKEVQLLRNILILNQENSQIDITAQQSNIYIVSQNIQINDVKIIRQLSYPEFALLESESISITNIDITLDQSYYTHVLHSSKDCVKQFVNEKQYSSIFFIINSKDISMENLNFYQLIILNKPLIFLQSQEAIISRRQEKISLLNSQFQNITMLQTVIATQQSIFQILSEQDQFIVIKNLLFFANHQNSYVNDISYKSSAVILINSPNGQIELRNSLINQNLVTSSVNSIIIVKADQLLIDNCYFNQNNQYNFEFIRKYFIWGFDDQKIVYYEDFTKTYPIESNGGSGQFIINNLKILNTKIYQSQALKGGGFYIETSGDGIVLIQNVTFESCSTTMNYDKSSYGGSLYFESSLSGLNLTIEDCQFLYTYSRTQGGAIFINPSLNSSNLHMQNIFVNESHSLHSAFLRISQSSSTSLYISINKIRIINSKTGFLNFLSKIDKISQSELTSQTNNYIFTLQQGYFKINNLFVSSFGYGVLKFQNVIEVEIINSQIEDIQLITQQLFDIKLNYLQQSSLVIDSLDVSFISIYTENSIETECSYFEATPLQSQCQYYPDKALTFFYYRENSTYVQTLSKCHLNLIAQLRNTDQSIIYIESLQKQQLVSINNVKIYNIICPDCVGLIKSTNIIQSTDKAIEYQIKNLNMSNNNCGLISCILILQNSVDSSLQKLNSLSRLLSSSDLSTTSIFRSNHTFVVQNSIFLQNKAQQCGVFLIDEIQTLINECSFIQNIANGFGGAITYLGDYIEQFEIYNSQISQNKATYGGGLFLSDHMVSDPSLLNLFLSQNEALIYGSDIVQYPCQLTITTDEGKMLLEKKNILNSDQQIIEQIVIIPYEIIGQSFKATYLMLPSGQKISEYQYFDDYNGQYIPYNLSLRIIPQNKQGERMKRLSQTTCTIQGRYLDINTEKEINSFSDKYTNLNKVIFNETSQDYNLDELIIKFDPDLNNQYILQLAFACDSVKIPVFYKYPPYQFKEYNQNYTLFLNVQTFKCQRGEQKINQDGTCQQCDSSSDQYSVQAGDICQIKDSSTMLSVSAAQIKLRAGYWRAYLSSSKIQYCLNLDTNCLGGWQTGDKSCFLGHIGALCEQCDIYNIRGDGQYSTSTMYKCGSCLNVGDNTLKIVFISLWTIISIFMSVRGSVDSIETLIKTQRLEKLGIASHAPKSGYDAVLIKVITNYFQIVGTITTFQLKIPSTINTTFSSVGNPVETMSYSLDCLLITMSDINIIYFRMIWSLIMPLIYLTGFFFLYGTAIILSVAKRNLSILTTALIYMYIFMQPTLIGGFISLLSFRQIGGIYWVQGNVSYIYNTQQHFKWLATFVMPSVLIIGCIIPLFMYIRLYKIKNNLNSVESRKQLGYLYNEYRKETYYWEIIKIIQKGLIIAMLTFYQDQIVIKAALIFIIVFIYQLLTKSKRPYQFNQLNEMDNQSTIVCGTSIVIAMTIYSATISNNTEIVWPFYILLIILNGYFCLILILEVIEAQIDKNIELIDKIRDKINSKFPTLQYKNNFNKRILENSQARKLRIRRRFQLLKNYLLSIVKSRQNIVCLNDSPILNYGPPFSDEQNQAGSDKRFGMPRTSKIYPEPYRINIENMLPSTFYKSTTMKTTWLRFHEGKKEFFDD